MSPLLTKEEFSLFSRETQLHLIRQIGTLKATRKLEGEFLYHVYGVNGFYVEVIERRKRVLTISLNITHRKLSELALDTLPD